MYFNNFQNYQQPNKSMDWIMVQTIEQVESVSVPPNTKAWIMVQNEPIFALRQSDGMGLTTTEYYHFERYEKKAPAVSNYVTAEQLQEAIERLKGELNESIIRPNDATK